MTYLTRAPVATLARGCSLRPLWPSVATLPLEAGALRLPENIDSSAGFRTRASNADFRHWAFGFSVSVSVPGMWQKSSLAFCFFVVRFPSLRRAVPRRA
jgi:hypothetical protein